MLLGGTHIRRVGRNKLNLDSEVVCQLAKGQPPRLVNRAVVEDHDAAGNVFALDKGVHVGQDLGCQDVHETEMIHAASDRAMPNESVTADAKQEGDSVIPRWIGAKGREDIIRHHRRRAVQISSHLSHAVHVAHPAFVE